MFLLISGRAPVPWRPFSANGVSSQCVCGELRREVSPRPPGGVVTYGTHAGIASIAAMVRRRRRRLGRLRACQQGQGHLCAAESLVSNGCLSENCKYLLTQVGRQQRVATSRSVKRGQERVVESSPFAGNWIVAPRPDEGDARQGRQVPATCRRAGGGGTQDSCTRARGRNRCGCRAVPAGGCVPLGLTGAGDSSRATRYIEI